MIEQARLTIDEQGVNTLFVSLGMLHSLEANDSDRVLRAPLILLPVALERGSARTGYTLSTTDNDPLVNVALVRALEVPIRSRSARAAGLGETMPDGYNINTWFTEAARTLGVKKRWSVKADVYLGHFSFQKFVMYKDLESKANALAEHRLIRLLARETVLEDAAGGLPSNVRELDLDRDYVPEVTHQIVDADSSQLRAIAAAARGHDLVLEGPPGTGKSQTITNLIAQALAVGKSVLFVAEKMAALKVVHDRLTAAGLGDFCLELHSTKANKRSVIAELGRSLDSSLGVGTFERKAAERIPAVRSALNDYVRALHEPHGQLRMSPYAAYGALAGVGSAARLRSHGPVETLDRSDLERISRTLRDLAASAIGIGKASEHPWRDASKAFYSEDDLDAIGDDGQELIAGLTELQACSDSVEASFGLPSVRSFGAMGAISTSQVFFRARQVYRPPCSAARRVLHRIQPSR